MAERLTLARAARLLGVSRNLLQEEIRAGRLMTFEGGIALDELLRAYPDAALESTAMLDRMQSIMDHAAFKMREENGAEGDPDRMQQRLADALRELSLTHRELIWYAQTLDELMERLSRLQERCDGAQRIQMASLTTWLCDKIDSA